MKFRKILSLALAAVTACNISVSAAASPADASAAADVIVSESVSRKCLAPGGKFIQDGLMFTELEDGTYEVGYDYNGKKPSGAVIIPETVNGKRVTRIAEAGFFECDKLVSVTVPDCVISAGTNAFVGTPFLDGQSGPVKYAGKVAVYCDKDAEKVTVKKGTLGLADRLFFLAEELKTAVLPKSLINIGNMTFDGCSSLTSVNIPDGMETIGSGVFFGCSALATVKIPKSVTAIGSYAFAESGIRFADLTNVVKIGKGAFENSKLGVNNVTIGKGHIDIGAKAFEGTMFSEALGKEKYLGTVFLGCDKDIESVKIKKGTTAIADMAFSSCKNLKSVTIPASVKTIGEDAFFNCPLLSSVTIPEGVESIAEDAFRLCCGLETVSLPMSLKAVGEGAFYGCGVKTLTYPGSVADWANISAGSDSMPSVQTTFGKKPNTLAPITGLAVTEAAENSISLKWKKSSNATGYLIELYKGGKWTEIGRTDSGTTKFTAKGLTQCTKHSFRISALTHNVKSKPVKISGTTKIGTVTKVKAAPSETEIMLSWAKNNAADCYQVEVYKNGKWVFVKKTKDNKTNTCSVTGLSPETKYTMRIFAFKDGEYSAPAVVSASTTVSVKPAAVTGLKASSGTKNIKLSWSKSANADSYQIDMYKGGKWVYVAKITGTSYNVTGLSAKTSYKFRIFAFKGKEYSSSTQISATTKAPVSTKPAAVTGLKASSGTKNIKLSWSKSANADSYQIDMYKGGKWVYVAKITGTSYNVTGLSAKTSYKFKIFAFKGKEYSSSTQISAATKAAASTKPAAVTGLKASSGTNNIKLSWNKSANADSYQIDMYKGGKWVYVAKIAGTSYNVTGLSRNTAYDFRVFAFKGSQYSSSARISASTAATLAPPIPYDLAPSDNAPAALSEVNTKLKGIDVSGWQGIIDFNVVKESGVDFVIVKAGEEYDTVDTWETNYANAKKAGLMVGAYWYSYATTLEDGKKEAKAFAAALKGKQLDFPVFFDLEERAQFDLGVDFCTKLVNTFCGVLEKSGYYAGVYCSTFWYTNYVKDNVRLKRPAWIADYRGRCYYDAACGMWQYGIGRVDGIQGDCDLDWGYIDYSKYIKANKLNGY